MTYSAAERGEIAADLEALYRVGRVQIPGEADELSGVTERLSQLVDSVNSRAAQLGDPQITQNVMQVGALVTNALVRTLTTLNDVAAGLVYVADDFVARDEYAREVFAGLGSGLTTGPVGQAEVPGTLDPDQLAQEGDGDDYAAVPEYQDPDDELADRDDELDDVVDETPEVDGIVR